MKHYEEIENMPAMFFKSILHQGLTASALGFRLHMAWLSRCALLALLLLAAGQAALQPDRPESLARRLWEDACSQADLSREPKLFKDVQGCVFHASGAPQ